MTFLQLSHFYSCPLQQPQNISFISHTVINSEPASSRNFVTAEQPDRPQLFSDTADRDQLAMDWVGSEFLLPLDVEEFRLEKNVKPEKVNYLRLFMVGTQVE